MNISEALKKFLRKMVGSNEYKNNSNVMRDALVRLMSEKDGAVGELTLDSPDFAEFLPSMTSSVLVTIPESRTKLEKKLNRIEVHFHSTIVYKSAFCHQGLKTITYILEDTMDTIQNFITDINSMENLQSFRYVIHEPEE
jgi:Arc/MetJ-type ribon-helix-helix transcriptional regulator